MNYNTALPKLIIPEYGRHIQIMVNHCMALEDRADRNEFAEAIIDVMGTINPQLRDVPDFKHKLWDQLFIMSNFTLDVDSPYPIVSKEVIFCKPKRLTYPTENYKYRYYGRNIKKMINVALTWADGDKKEALVMVIANHMKKCYLTWNKDQVDDKVIFAHLSDISNGKIILNEAENTLISQEKIQVNKSKSYTPTNRNTNTSSNNARRMLYRNNK